MERFKDDWNANKEFLMYCMEIIKRMGYYRALQDAQNWYLASSELYANIGSLIDKKISARLNQQLMLIHQTLDGSSPAPKSKLGQVMALNQRYEALSLLDEFHREVMNALHTARLILPKSDRRLGLKRLEEDFGITR